MATVESTRSRILNAAIEMMDAGGESSVRLGAIAEALGIKEPSIYHHFTNRTELVNAAYVEWYWQCLRTDVPVDSMMLMVENQDDYERALRKSMEWSYRPERHKDRAIRASVLGAAQTNPELAAAINKINRKFLNGLADSLRLAQSKGWARTDLDPMAAAYWLHGQINGRVVAEMDPGAIDLDAWDAISFEVVFTLLRPRP
jgi:AcrR family transcriptional regulator